MKQVKMNRQKRTQDIQKLIEQGRTQAEIATQLGISRQAVNQLLNREKFLEVQKRYKQRLNQS